MSKSSFVGLLGLFLYCLRFVSSCPPLPDVPNGILKVISPVKVEVICHPSYRYSNWYLQRSNITRCRKGEWSDPKPVCFPRNNRCPKLNTEIPHGKVLVQNEYKAGAVARYYCNDNYVLVGEAERRCQDVIYQWTGSDPECKGKFANVADKIKENFVDKLSNFSGVGRFIDVGVEKQGLDLFLVFDKSNSIHPDEFQHGIKFAKFLVRKFNVSNGPATKVGGTRVAAISFGDVAKVAIELHDSNVSNVNEVIKRLENIKCGQLCDGETNMNEAIQMVIKMVDSKARPKAKKAMFLTSDGAPTGRSPFNAAETVRKKDVEIFAVGVGQDIDRDTLNKVATKPSDEHVFLLKSFSDFDEILSIIHGQTPEEPTGPAHKCGFLSEKGKAALNTSVVQTKVGAWPWLAAILFSSSDYKMSFQCNGILICQSWVLTSAKCLFKDGKKLSNEELVVVLGDDDLTAEEDSEQNFLVSEIFIHDEFDVTAKKIRYNLGLIKLASEADLNDDVRTVCLPKADEYWSHNPSTKGKMIGWLTNKYEITRIPDQIVPIFRPSQAELTVLGKLQCESYLTGNYTKRNSKDLFCAGTGLSSVKCSTDSGNSFIYEDRSHRRYVLGIATHSTGCKINEKAGIFTRVKDELDWINDITDACGDNYN